MEDINIPWVSVPLPEWVAVPALTLAFLIASVNVFVFHLLVARPEHSALYFWPFALAGFASGQFLGMVVDLPVGVLGDVYWLAGSIAAWLGMAIANAIATTLKRE